MIVHRRDACAKIIQDRAFANEKISFVWDTVVEEIVGNEMVVTGVKAGMSKQMKFLKLKQTACSFTWG